LRRRAGTPLILLLLRRLALLHLLWSVKCKVAPVLLGRWSRLFYLLVALPLVILECLVWLLLSRLINETLLVKRHFEIDSLWNVI
jgi:hypothetical protein